MKSLKLMRSTSIVNLTLLASIAVAQNTGANLNSIKDNWTGFYGGFNIGGIFNDIDLKSNHFGLANPAGTCNKNSNYSSFFPGVQLGYLSQFESKFILGIEGDFTYNVNRTSNINCDCSFTSSVSDHYSIKNRSQGSVRGRLGYLVKPHMLPFVSAGGSFADLGTAYSNEGGDKYSTTITKAGWLVGAGLEWNFFPTWSVRTEYYHVNYNNINLSIPNIYGLYDSSGSAHVNLSSNNIRLAINHWF
jgi:outer membrane immunogenic protein